MLGLSVAWASLWVFVFLMEMGFALHNWGNMFLSHSSIAAQMAFCEARFQWFLFLDTRPQNETWNFSLICIVFCKRKRWQQKLHFFTISLKKQPFCSPANPMRHECSKECNRKSHEKVMHKKGTFRCSFSGESKLTENPCVTMHLRCNSFFKPKNPKNANMEFRTGFACATFVNATSHFAHRTRMCNMMKMDSRLRTRKLLINFFVSSMIMNKNVKTQIAQSMRNARLSWQNMPSSSD